MTDIKISNNGFILCPKCGGKTKTKVNKDTRLYHFPLFCPKCKQESIIDVMSDVVSEQQRQIDDERKHYES